jgi:hypothetical protein
MFFFFFLVREKKGKHLQGRLFVDVTHMKKDDSFLNDDIADKVVCV